MSLGTRFGSRFIGFFIALFIAIVEVIGSSSYDFEKSLVPLHTISEVIDLIHCAAVIPSFLHSLLHSISQLIGSTPCTVMNCSIIRSGPYSIPSVIDFNQGPATWAGLS